MVGVTAHALASIYPKFNPVVYSQKGCAPPDVVGDFWRVYVPDLVLQTIVFGATLWPAVELWRRGQHSQLLTRVVRDGGLFYVVVFTAVAFTAIGSLQQKSFPVMLAAAYSDLLLAVSCVAVSRLMLSIHSLASHLSMDLSMLLSTAELSRIRWKRGMHDGELIVEIDTVEGVELDGLMGSSENLRAPAVHMSTVGAYADAFPLELRRDISTAGASAQYAKR
ncbi:uncharacterized protein B0H18DRAFT_1014600 [Fomitopsis serialis]|uniref:uncharacterized protein n=1 Tax=Fomitopsis serialis TaxID=139415 RepID=UPI002008B37E|nr:uncharacterized protein B0H18DRAFT_1014600 [Neoantrodia serialis]KAH9923677.1 hypothetical protein B0H18DRAFT_1014600 [Neoantrodia serialis]